MLSLVSIDMNLLIEKGPLVFYCGTKQFSAQCVCVCVCVCFQGRALFMLLQITQTIQICQKVQVECHRARHTFGIIKHGLIFNKSVLVTLTFVFFVFFTTDSSYYVCLTSFISMANAVVIQIVDSRVMYHRECYILHMHRND